MNTTIPPWWLDNIGPGNGLVPSGSDWPKSVSPYGITRPRDLMLYMSFHYIYMYRGLEFGHHCGCRCPNTLTHWGRVTHICVGNLTIIVSDNGLSPGRRQAITWTNAGILLIGPLGTNFSEMLIEIHTFSFKKIHLKMSSGKWRPFCLGLNVLISCHSADLQSLTVMFPSQYDPLTTNNFKHIFTDQTSLMSLFNGNEIS